MKLKVISLAIALITQHAWAEEFEVYVGSSAKSSSGFEEYKGSADEKITTPKTIRKKSTHSKSTSASETATSAGDVELVMTRSSSFKKVEEESRKEVKARETEDVSDLDATLKKALSHKTATSKKHYKKMKDSSEDLNKVIELTDKNKTEVAAPRKNEYIVSNDPISFNEVNVPFSVTKILFPALVPVEKEKIVYENENKKITFSFKSEGFNRSFPVKFIGENQSVIAIFTPKPLDVGAVVTIKTDKNTVNDLVRASPQMMPREVPTEADIQLMNRLMDNNLSDDFTDLPLPKVSKFENAFIAVPLMKKSNGTKNVLTFQLVSTNGAVTTVANKQFYKPGVTAVSLDRQTVEPNKITHLYIIEEADDNGR